MTAPSEPSGSIPAFLFVDEATLDLRVAALPLLDRLLVSVYRAGAGPIIVVAKSPLPPLPRSTALGVPFEVRRDCNPASGPAFVSKTNVLIHASDVRTLIQQGGRLVSTDGKPLLVGRIAGRDEDWEAELKSARPVQARMISAAISDRDSAVRAERALWDSLNSDSDGLVDRVFNRPCGRFLSRVLIHTPVSPNAVSLASVLMGLVAAWLFAQGNYSALIGGAVLFQISAIIDCVDGDIARIMFKESALGKWLDLAGDQVVHVGVFAGIAWGAAQSGTSSPVLALGLASMTGALISFGVVVRGMRLAASDRGGRLRKLMDAATNRDFSVLVLCLAVGDMLEWFLWMSAFGSHAFWVLALWLQRGLRAK